MYRLILSSWNANKKSGLQNMWRFIGVLYIFPTAIRMRSSISIGIVFMIYLCIILCSICSNRVSKGMFICPTTDSDRHQYLMTGIRMKAIFLAAINAFCMLLCYLIAPYSLLLLPFELGYFTIFELMMDLTSIGFIIPSDKKAQQKLYEANRKIRSNKEYHYSIFLSIFSAISLLILICTDMLGHSDLVIHSILLSLNVILFTYFLIKYARDLFLISTDYEVIYASNRRVIRRKINEANHI